MNRNLVNFCVLVALSVMGVPNVGHAQETGFSPVQKLVKLNTTAGRGTCLKKANPSILKSLGVEASEAQNQGGTSSRLSDLSNNDPRLQSLSSVMSAIAGADKLGKLKKIIKGTKFYFGRPGVKNNPRSRQAAYGIQLNPGGQNVTGGGTANLGGTDNAALIAHEFGHKVGNSSGNYAAYKAHMKGTSCTISHYGHTHRGSPNEHFADVFAAYVTNPGLFHNKGEGCKRSFEFFRDILFGETGLKKRCDSRKSSGGRFGANKSGGGGDLSALIQAIKSRKAQRKKDREKRAERRTEEQRRRGLICSNSGRCDNNESLDGVE